MTEEEHRESMYKSKGKISEVFRGKEDHGIETVVITIDGAAWRQGFGTLCFDSPTDSAEFMRSVCEVFGVLDQERLIGMDCFALREFPYGNEPIAALTAVDTGRTFSLDAWRQKKWPEERFHAQERKLASIRRERQQLLQRLEDISHEEKRLSNDYRPVVGEAP